MSFMGTYSPLANIVIVHIFDINETTPRPFHDCNAEGGALVYTWGAKRPASRRLAIYIGSHPSPNHPPYAQHATHPSTHSLNQPFNPSVCPVLIVEPIDFQPI
jgi:hypothetical protein